MSKTGFSNGFANVPTSKYYKYHGLVRSCNTEPVLPPYLEFHNGNVDTVWVRLYCDLRVVGEYFYLYYDYVDVLPSAWNDNCANKFPDGKERYYFLELYLQKVPAYETVQIDINYGDECKYYEYVMTEEYEHIAMPFNLYAGYDWIFRYKYTQAASANRVWKTSDGKFSVAWPVPKHWK